MVAAAVAQGLTPGFKFDPTVEQLLQFYLLPYLRYRQLPICGAVFLDDPTTAPPWALLDRHDRGEEDEAYFIIPAAGDGRGGRQQVSRSVASGGKWIKQRTEDRGKVIFDDETFRWEKFSLNFHADDQRRSGSTGWVMHEYAVVPPPGSSIVSTHRASHIAFTGHGQNRKRVPDGYVAAVAPPPSPMLCEPSHSAASYDGSNQAYEQGNQQLLPAVEQSNQEYYVQEEQSNQEYPAYSEQNQWYFLTEQQSNQQEYAYDQQQGCCWLPLPGQSNQDFAYYEQQHLFHGDLTSWQEQLPTSQQFLGQEQVLPDGLDGYIADDVQTISAAPPPSPMLCEPPHSGASHGGSNQVDQQLLPAVEQSNQDNFPAAEQSNQDCFLPRQSNQKYSCDQQDDAYEQQHHIHGDLPSWQEPLATPQQFLDQAQPSGLNVNGGAVISDNGEHAAAPAARPPVRHYNGPVPMLDSAFLDKMKAYLTADARGLCGNAVKDQDAPTNGEHAAAAPAPAAADGNGDALPPVVPDTTELPRVVGLLLREVQDIVKVAEAGGYGCSSDEPLSADWTASTLEVADQAGPHRWLRATAWLGGVRHPLCQLHPVHTSIADVHLRRHICRRCTSPLTVHCTPPSTPGSTSLDGAVQLEMCT
ncbi:hypothetical protein E2562_010312 [Oryza meyeriana var. granulata]|uniref:NAC domain-containing protein n=1 Tax=Oryza meyeriana var. granulata TaxID=110450 RepID=A0A6G1F6C9_9ORYZ|nr:hypothetical protein E2562_010312 [Oryza meyeriana var. granulata]